MAEHVVDVLWRCAGFRAKVDLLRWLYTSFKQRKARYPKA